MQDFFNQCHKIDTLDEDQIFREIMQQPVFSSDSESHSPTTQNNSAATAEGGIYGGTTIATNNKCENLMIKSNSSNSIFSQHAPQKPVAATSPMAYIISFDDSTVVAATRENYGGKQPYQMEQRGSGGALIIPPSKEKHELLEPRANQTTRKVRSSAETLDHIVAERKRRRELTERFIALSATIPGLKKVSL